MYGVTLNTLIKTLLNRSGAWAALTTLLAFVALVLAAWVPNSGIIITALLLLALLVVGVRHRKGLLHGGRSSDALAAYLVTRFLVLGAVVAQAATTANEVPMIVLAAFVLGLPMTAETPIRQLRSKARPFSSNLEGVHERIRGAFKYGYLFPLNFVALVLVVLITPLSQWQSDLEWLAYVPVVLAVVGVVYAAATLIDLALRIRSQLAFEALIEPALDRLAPVFYLHWHAPAGTAYQIAMWLPYLEKLGVPFAVIVRTRGNFNDTRELTDRPVIMRESLESLDPLIRPTLKGIFYVNTATRNSHFIRYSHLTHIQLNHGDSDKAPSFNPVFRMFDLDFVAGQAAIDRFAAHNVKMPDDMFRIVGRPQVEEVEIATQQIGEIAGKSVLYAPTWSGFYEDTDYSSLRVGPQMVRELLDRGCRVVFRPHPYYRRNPDLVVAANEIERMLAADGAKTGREHLFGATATTEMSVFDCFNASDAMISDVSSVVGDYLFSEKPLAMVAVTHSAHDFHEEFPMSRSTYLLDGTDASLDADELSACLDQLLGTDPMREARRASKTYYLGDIPAEHYSQRFVDEALAALGTDVAIH